MSLQKPTKLQLAVHEAGHAYAFAALIDGEVPSQMGLSINADGDLHGWSSRRKILLREVRFATLGPDIRPSWVWQAEVETAIAVAGPLAEFWHPMRSRIGAALFTLSNADKFLTPDFFDVDGDFQRVWDSLAHVASPDPLGTLKRMIDIADKILATNWLSIRLLARRLFELGLFEIEELEQWFELHPARQYHHTLRTSDLEVPLNAS